MRSARRFPGFRLRLTRWGGVFLLSLLVLGAAAVNTGNNTLMMMVGVAMGSFVVSGAWSRQVLGNLEIEVRPPRELFAGRSAAVEVTLHNRGRLVPAYGVVVRDRDGSVLLAEPFLAAGETHRHAARVTRARRGRQWLGPWRVEVLLPLGFFLKSKEVVRGVDVLVYPELLPTAAVPLERGGGRSSVVTETRRGREGDVMQLRPFQGGDERRHVHWKQTARQQTLIVAEREAAVEEPRFLVVDLRVEDPSDPRVLERFERMISEVATVAVGRLRRRLPVGLVLGRQVIAPVADLSRSRALLAPLAQAAPAVIDAPPPRTAADAAVLAAFRLEGAA